MPVTLDSSTLILLGAGASAEAGVPTSTEMTRQLVERIATVPRLHDEVQALRFVCGALMAHDSATGGDPYAGLDVERVFAAVQLLATRDDLEVTPFVATWHPAVDSWGRARVPMGFDRDLQRAILSERPFSGAERLITRLIDARLKRGSDAIYSSLQQEMTREMGGLLATVAKDVSHLHPLVEAARRGSGIAVATLNYDQAMEQACGALGVPVHVGVEGWAQSRLLEWPEDGLQLYKLHGSIDWQWMDLDRADGQIPLRTVVRTDERPNREPAVIFGQRGKLRAEGPFLGLLAEFEKALSLRTRVVAIGYSFRDDHVNEVLSRWLRENMTRTITIVDPHFPERPERGDFRQTLTSNLIPLRSGEFPARLDIVRERAGVALAGAAT